MPDTDSAFLPVVLAQDTKPQLQDGHLILTAPTGQTTGQTLEFAPKGTAEIAADTACVTCAANG